MSVRTGRHVELLELSAPLHRYASSLQTDANASSFLVHRALAAAFAKQPQLRPGLSLEASLREDIDRSFALQDQSLPDRSSCHCTT